MMLSLAELIQKGDISSIRKAIECDLIHEKQKDENGFTTIHWAVYFDEVEVLKLLLSLDKACIYSKTKRGFTALHIAVLQTSLRSIALLGELSLLKCDCDSIINTVNDWGETPLHLSASVGCKQTMELLLKYGCDQALKDNWGRTAIDVAIQNGYESQVKSLMNESYVSINSPDNSTSEELPTQSGAVIAELMSRISEMKHSYGTTSSTLVRHIFSADVETFTIGSLACNKENNQKCCAGPKQEMGQQQQHQTPHVSAPTIAAVLPLSKRLEYPGDPLQLREWIQSASLHIDTSVSVEEAVALQAAESRVVNGKDMFGLSALHKAACWDKSDLVAELLSSKCLQLNDTTNDKTGRTALHCCVEEGACRVLSMLLSDPRIDTLARDASGRTARDLAVEKGESRLVEMFDQSINCGV